MELCEIKINLQSSTRYVYQMLNIWVRRVICCKMLFYLFQLRYIYFNLM